MKRLSAIVLSFVLCVGLLTGCGKNYSADASTVFVEEKGKIVSTDVEEFDTDKYDEKSFKEYVEDQIKDYNDENGKGAVSLKKISVKDGKATLTIKYDSYADYTKFNGVEIFAGTAEEALVAGYKIDEEICKVEDGKLTSMNDSGVVAEEGLKVVVFKGKGNIKVDGTIQYVTNGNITIVDDNTICIGEAGEAASTEVTEAPSESLDNTEGTESVSVEDEDLIVPTTEQASTEYTFPEDTNNSTSVVNDKYTVIYYK